MSDSSTDPPFVKQTFDFWVNPEVERRRQQGTLPPNFVLYRAQIVMNLGQPHQIRLNDEVKAVILLDVDDVAKKAVPDGHAIKWDQVTGISAIHLTAEDPNAAHVTLVAIPNRGWAIEFDFRYNATRVAGTAMAAEEFLQTATFAAKGGLLRAFHENLFAASELTAKGNLLLWPDPEFLAMKRDVHTHITSKLNLQGHHGNVDAEFVELHNQLGKKRGDARYVGGTVSYTAEEMTGMLAVARSALDALRADTPTVLKKNS